MNRIVTADEVDAYVFCGEICSGKSKILKKICEITKAAKFSTGQVIEDDLLKLSRLVNRYSMQAHGDTDPKRWALELAAKAYESMKEGKSAFGFECMRYPEQIQIMLDAFPRAFVVGVIAPFEMRFKWIRERNRDGDPQTVEELREVDRRDWEGYLTKVGQNTGGCFEMIEQLAREKRGIIVYNKQEGEEYLEAHARKVIKAFDDLIGAA